jgi:hypothetical protein
LTGFEILILRLASQIQSAAKSGAKIMMKSGIYRLEPGRGHFKAADLALGKVFCKQLQRSRRLFESGPKDGRSHEKDRDHENTFLFVGVQSAGDKDIQEIQNGQTA